MRGMLRDEATITVRSGNGGNGCVSFRREKYVPEGGPDGGDGGRGGNVVLVANHHLNTLNAFARKRTWKARPGLDGLGRKKHGKQGEDLLIEMPCGTIVRHAETGELLADLTESGQQVIIAAGGIGGRGNVHFKSSINQTPRKAGSGKHGVEVPLALELKLLADVGLIGFPNAGKSTLLSRLSEAKAKVGDYPFTTLEPQLGVVERDDRQLVVADIPGLIEGAAEGIGLGHQFLRHVERCALLVHLVDGSDGDAEALMERIAVLNRELARFSPKLAEKPQLLALNKVDARPELSELAAQVSTQLDQPVAVLSGVSGAGVRELESRLLALVDAT